MVPERGQEQALAILAALVAGESWTAMESFVSLLQKNVLNRKRWRTREELRLANVTRIEAYLQAPLRPAPDVR
jgi:putative transposase